MIRVLVAVLVVVVLGVALWSVLGQRSADDAGEPSDEVASDTDRDGAGGGGADDDPTEADDRADADRRTGDRTDGDTGGAPPGDAAGDRPSTAVLWSGTFDADDWPQHFGVVAESRTFAEAVDVGPDGREDVLRIDFGGAGERWGIDYRSSLDDLDLPALNAVEFGYDAYFASGFEFIGDGKFGGLAGISDGLDPLDTSSGGDFNDQSFSARAMWQRDRGVVGYLYVARADGLAIDDDDNFGFGIQVPFVADDGATAGIVSTGVWHRITHRVVMNTPGEADGVYQLAIDGHRGIDLHDVEFRTGAADDLAVNQLMSTWFFGGGPDQFPTRENTAYTANWTLAIPEDLLD